MTGQPSGRRQRHLADALADFYIALSGALLGAAAGAYVSAKLAAEQQAVAAKGLEGAARQDLEASAESFSGVADSLMQAGVGMAVALALVLLFRALSAR